MQDQSGKASTAADVAAAERHELLADIARGAIPSGWTPPAPQWITGEDLVEIIDEALALATNFVDTQSGDAAVIAQLRVAVRNAATDAGDA